MKKKIILTSGFFTFVLFGCFQFAKAQQKEIKEVNLTISIMNGDTIVNGKNFKNISEKERVELRKNFDHIEIRTSASNPQNKIRRMTVITTNDQNNLDSNVIKFKMDGPEKHFMEDKDHKVIIINGDKEMIDGMPSPPHVRMEFKSLDGDMSMIPPTEERDFPPHFKNGAEMRSSRPNLPNSNSYNFISTDKNGFTTKTKITVEEPFRSELKTIFNNQNAPINSLELNNLLFYPNFSKGTTTLSFSTSAKATIEVKMLDGDGHPLFLDKKTLSSDTYVKQFILSKNGIYYLQVNQGNNTFIRKVIKE